MFSRGVKTDKRSVGVTGSWTGLRWMLIAVSSLAISGAAGCGADVGHDAVPTATASHESGTHQIHWGYDGETGPDHWADLSPDYAMCREGSAQSPIDLASATSVAGPPIYAATGGGLLTSDQPHDVLDISDNGHTIQVTDETPSSLDLDGEHYELIQYHFHAPSEHTLDGRHAPLEVHLVHKSATGRLAVVGVLIDEGDHDAEWDSIVDALPEVADESRRVEGDSLDVTDLLPLAGSYYRYSGSLTTPPCSEGVEWIVMADAHELGPNQIAALTSRLHHNNRPAQPRGERPLELVAP